MAAIWTPRDIARPDVIEPYGIAEIFADGGIVRVDGPWRFTVLYLREGDSCTGIMRVRMLRQGGPPPDGYEASLIRAYVDTMGGARH
jgi:hypothetical protein